MGKGHMSGLEGKLHELHITFLTSHDMGGIYHVMSVNHFCWLNADGLSYSDHLLGYIRKIWDWGQFTWHFTTNWNPLLKCHTNFPAKGVFKVFLTECKIWQIPPWLKPWKPEIFKHSAINKVTLIVLSFVQSF